MKSNNKIIIKKDRNKEEKDKYRKIG